MKFPLITEPVTLVVGDAVVEVGRLVVETTTPSGFTRPPGADPAALVVPVTGRLELDPEFVAFVERHRPAQDATAEPATTRPPNGLDIVDGPRSASRGGGQC